MQKSKENTERKTSRRRKKVRRSVEKKSDGSGFAAIYEKTNLLVSTRTVIVKNMQQF